MLPSTTLNTHILSFADSEGRKDIPITTNKAQIILKFLSDPSKPSHYHLLDENGNFKEAIPRRIIKGVKEIERNQESKAMRWICDCGRKNFMHIWPPEKCECKGDRTVFFERLLALHPHKIK